MQFADGKITVTSDLFRGGSRDDRPVIVGEEVFQHRHLFQEYQRRRVGGEDGVVPVVVFRHPGNAEFLGGIQKLGVELSGIICLSIGDEKHLFPVRGDGFHVIGIELVGNESNIRGGVFHIAVPFKGVAMAGTDATGGVFFQIAAQNTGKYVTGDTGYCRDVEQGFVDEFGNGGGLFPQLQSFSGDG